MQNATLEKAFNEQINYEMFSAYMYMSMSAHLTNIGLKGMARWLMVQYHEEMFHAMKMYEFVQKRAGVVNLEKIIGPQHTWKSPLDVFESVYKHELGVTKRINALMDLAIAEKDHASQIFIQWFVTEQLEEEQNDCDIITHLKLIGSDTSALLSFDKELGARALTVPTDFSSGVEAAAGAVA